MQKKVCNDQTSSFFFFCQAYIHTGWYLDIKVPRKTPKSLVKITGKKA